MALPNVVFSNIDISAIKQVDSNHIYITILPYLCSHHWACVILSSFVHVLKRLVVWIQDKSIKSENMN